MTLQGAVFKLSNGNTIPAVGYGVGTKWFKFGQNQIDDDVTNAVQAAIETGAIHIDGAEVYNTNEEIGKALINVGVKREDVFITNKYFAGDGSYTFRSTEANPYDALKADLKILNVDYVDLYLIHAPFIKNETHGFDLCGAWQYLEKLVDDGYARNIGVSNFTKEDVEVILNSKPKYKPVINQIEYNAYLQNQTPGIVEFSMANGILVEAYSPLGPLLKGKPGPIDELVNKLATKYSKTDGQILLRSVLQNGILPITTSSKRERIKASLEIFDFELTNDEVNEINKLGEQKTLRQYWTNEYSKYD